MLYLFFGPNDLARGAAVAALKRTIPDDLLDLNCTVLDGRRLRPIDVIQACDALPFIHERRLVIVEDALKGMKAEGDGAAAKPAPRGRGKKAAGGENLVEYIAQLPATADLVFVETGEFDKRVALYNALKKHGQVREFPVLLGAELQRWLAGEARELGVKLSAEAGQLLAEFVGSDGRALRSELAKLAAFVNFQGTIDAAAVRRMVEDASETSVFKFIDALASRRLGPALQTLREVLAEGQPAPLVFGLVGRQVRLLLGVSELQKSRLRPDEMAARLGQNPFAVRKAAEQAARFTTAALLTLHDRLTELDHWSKSGRIESDTALELLVAETCQG